MGKSFSHLPLARRHEIYAAQLRKQVASAENLFRAHLAALGLPYRFQPGIFKPRHRIVDFYFAEHNLIAEIDGPYHDREKDLKRDQELQMATGVRIPRLTHDLVVTAFVKRRRSTDLLTSNN